MHHGSISRYMKRFGAILPILCAAASACQKTNAGAECFRQSDCGETGLCKNGVCVYATDTDSTPADSEADPTDGSSEGSTEIPADTGSDTESDERSTETDAVPDGGATDMDAGSDGGATETDTASNTDTVDTGTPSDSSPPAIAKICLDPGRLSAPEEDGDLKYAAIINRKVTFYLEDFFLESGYDVLMTMNDIPEDEIFASSFNNEGADEQARVGALSPADRLKMCHDWGADYIISIQHNSVEDSGPNYIRVYHNPSASTWANNTLHQLTLVMSSGATGAEAFTNDDFTILRDAAVPALMTFASFYSNPDERNRLNDNQYLGNEASAIFNGFTETF